MDTDLLQIQNEEERETMCNERLQVCNVMHVQM